MNRTKTLLVFGAVLLLAAATVYAYFFTSESQSSQVERVDSGKADMIRALQEGMKQETPPTLGPPGQE